MSTASRSAAGLDRRRARVARCGPDNGDAFAASGQLEIEQTAEQLERHVLERKGGSVEQLDQMDVVTQLDERHDVVDVEGAVGGGHGVVEASPIERARHEGPHHAAGEGDVAIVGRLHRRPERRPVGGHVQPAVGGQAAEHGVGEGELGARAPRRDVPQRLLSHRR